MTTNAINSGNTGSRPADRVPSGAEGTVDKTTPRTALASGSEGSVVRTDPHVKTSFSMGGGDVAFQRLVGGFPRT